MRLFTRKLSTAELIELVDTVVPPNIGATTCGCAAFTAWVAYNADTSDTINALVYWCERYGADIEWCDRAGDMITIPFIDGSSLQYNLDLDNVQRYQVVHLLSCPHNRK